VLDEDVVEWMREVRLGGRQDLEDSRRKWADVWEGIGRMAVDREI